MKIAKYLALFLGLLIYVGGCSTDALRQYYKTGLVPDDYRYGDLYRLSNLPQFREAAEPCPKSVFQHQQPVHLYVIGDSFLEPSRISSGDFPVEHYQYTHWDRPRTVELNKARENILILESVERHFREKLTRQVASLEIVDDTLQTVVKATQPPVSWPERIRQTEELIASPGIEERLETMLFSNDLFLWFKEQKALLTQRWFGRVNPKVTVTPDGQHLLYGLDTDKTLINSSFNPVADEEVNRLVDTLNASAERYKKLGFSEVYLSIIPNKTSILAPEMGKYNHLIERIQQHPRLRVPVIDAYGPFRESRASVYQISDSHWTCEGRSLWLREAWKIFEKPL